MKKKKKKTLGGGGGGRKGGQNFTILNNYVHIQNCFHISGIITRP